MALAVHVQHVPDVDHLEERLENLVKELARLENHGRDLLRAIQDADAELTDDPAASGALVRKHKAAHGLRVVCRQLSRAQLVLIPAGDERRNVVDEVLQWLNEADANDRPWKAAA